MDEDDIRKWTEAARDARVKAASANDPVVQEMLLELADAYETAVRDAQSSHLGASAGALNRTSGARG